MKLLNKHNLAVTQFAGDGTRYTLDAILITENETVATNGHYLTRVSLPTEQKPQDFPVVEGFTPNGFNSTLLKVEDAIAIAKALPKKDRIPVLNCAAISRQDDELQVCVTDLENPKIFTPEIPSGRFPNWEEVMPKTNPKLTIYLSAEYLITIAKAFNKFTDDYNKTIRIQLWDANHSVRFDAVNRDTEQSMTTVLMPLRDGKCTNENSYGAPKVEPKVEL